jgi:hypothetical protein
MIDRAQIGSACEQAAGSRNDSISPLSSPRKICCTDAIHFHLTGRRLRMSEVCPDRTMEVEREWVVTCPQFRLCRGVGSIFFSSNYSAEVRFGPGRLMKTEMGARTRLIASPFCAGWTLRPVVAASFESNLDLLENLKIGDATHAHRSCQR